METKIIIDSMNLAIGALGLSSAYLHFRTAQFQRKAESGVRRGKKKRRRKMLSSSSKYRCKSVEAVWKKHKLNASKLPTRIHIQIIWSNNDWGA